MGLYGEYLEYLNSFCLGILIDPDERVKERGRCNMSILCSIYRTSKLAADLNRNNSSPVK